MSEEINFNRGKLLSGIIYPEFFPFSKEDLVLNIGCGDGVQAVIYKGNFKKMTGVDINEDRLLVARQLAEANGIQNWQSLRANVEKIPLDEKFDKAIAIDIIEHVEHPESVVKELWRLLKDGGRVLVTFPAMHDKWENFFRFVGRKVLRRKGKTVKKTGWDPDAHQYPYDLKKWQRILENGGFRLVKSRASTLWPPLHYLGIPKFWFSNKFIHALDNFFCRLPIFKKLGQSLVCIFEKQ
ncbi:MAG: class I SAM-dependent methyltransferase [bacterium]